MPNTKQRILDTSIRLFNSKGIASVRLQQIAEEIGISPGNLAYHFKNKEAILSAVNCELVEEAGIILKNYRRVPNLLDFHLQLSHYFEFLERYPFYFLDELEIERTYPSIGKIRREQLQQMQTQIQQRFTYNVERSILRPEPRAGIYESVVNTIWVLITYWVPVNLAKGNHLEVQEEHFKEVIWNQIFPYLTDIGKQEFEQLILPAMSGKAHL
ncbi:MAG: TetR/AcrR family transcriptional regulator [Bacteroidota bacterium]